MKRGKKKIEKTEICEVCGWEQETGKYYYHEKVYKTVGGVLVCENCVECRQCDKKIKKPRRGWQGGICSCKKCHGNHLEILHDRKIKIYPRRKNTTYVPMLKQNKKDFKIKHYVRLEKEFNVSAHGNAVRVIEIGMFHKRRGGVDRYHRLSQMGHSFFRVDPNGRINEDKLKLWHPGAHRLTIMYELDGFYGSDVKSINRAVKKLRGRGWRVVARKDRSGRRETIGYNEGMSSAEVKRNKHTDAFDEKAGRRHQNKIGKIDQKYDWRKPATNWLQETIKRRP